MKKAIHHKHRWIDVHANPRVMIRWCEKCGCLLTNHIAQNNSYAFPDFWAEQITPPSSDLHTVDSSSR